MNYDVNYFIDKFEKIPEENWCIGMPQDGIGKMCAAGHCGYHTMMFFNDCEEAVALAMLLQPLSGRRDLYEAIYYVNDQILIQYPQDSPKQRILAALRDIKAMEAKPQYPDITKTLAVLPSDEVSDLTQHPHILKPI